MTLRKRYIRNIKKNLSFYAAAVKLLDDLHIFYKDYHVEDGRSSSLTIL